MFTAGEKIENFKVYSAAALHSPSPPLTAISIVPFALSQIVSSLDELLLLFMALNLNQKVTKNYTRFNFPVQLPAANIADSTCRCPGAVEALPCYLPLSLFRTGSVFGVKFD